MPFFKSMGSVLTIIIMIAAGYILARAGWFDESVGRVFSKLVMNISLPSYMFYNIMSTFKKDELVSMAGNLAIPALSLAVCYLLAVAASNIIKVDRSRKGVFRSMFFASNTMFMGLPVNLALFGEKSIPYVLLYYLVNTNFYWTIGVYEISRDNPDGGKKPFGPDTLKNVLNPAVAGFTTGLIMVLAGIRPPSFLLDACKYIGGITTPLAMFFIGITLRSIKLCEIRPNREMISLILARSLVSPALVLLFNSIFKPPELMGAVFVIQSAMPVITSTSVVAREYGSDYRFAAVMSAVTTTTSLVVIPFYMWLMGSAY